MIWYKVYTELFIGCNWSYVNSLAPGRCSNYSKHVFKCIIHNSSWVPHCEVVLRGMPEKLTNEKSTLVKVVVWYCQATNLYVSKFWLAPMSPYEITRPLSQWHTALISQILPIGTHPITHPRGWYMGVFCEFEVWSMSCFCWYSAINTYIGQYLSIYKLFTNILDLNYLNPPPPPLQTKWPPFRRWYFQTHFHEWKFLYFDWNFTEVCP